MTQNVLRCSLPFILALVAAGTSRTSAQEASSAAPDSGTVFALEVGNRNYPGWREEWRVHLGETFYLGDSRFTARVEQFVPDFRINDQGEVLHYSDEPNNPAVRVVVYGDTAATDTTWAFLNFPPHFSANSFFAFRLMAVEGYEPPVAEADDPATLPGSKSAARKEEDDG